jgi:hypothetical protein
LAQRRVVGPGEVERAGGGGVEIEMPRGDARAEMVGQAQDGEGGDRLAGAGLADHCKGTAARELETEPVDRAEGPVGEREFHRQIVHPQNGVGGGLSNRHLSPCRSLLAGGTEDMTMGGAPPRGVNARERRRSACS